MSIIHQSTRPGEWVGVDYPDHPNNPVYLAFSNTNADVNRDDFKPAFYDSGKALIRCPSLKPGTYSLWAKWGTTIEYVSSVKVIE